MMILLYVLSACDLLQLSADSCDENTDCWKSFGLGFYCSNEDKNSENTDENNKDTLDFYYCENDLIHEDKCELLTNKNYFLYSDETSEVSNLTDDKKLDNLMTIIAETSEHPDWITAFDDLYAAQQLENGTDAEYLTPINVLLCDSSIEPMNLVDTFGTQFLLVTSEALQNRDMSESLRLLENETTHVFVVDSDKFGLYSAIESDERTVEKSNLTALSELDPDRIWYGIPSIEQELDILDRSFDDGLFLYQGSSIFPEDIENNIEYSSAENLDIGDATFIFTPYIETVFETILDKELEIYLYNVDNSILDKINKKIEEIKTSDPSTTISSSIYFFRNTCPIQDDLTYHALYLTYVVNSFLKVDQKSYLQGTSQSQMASRTKYFLENITSSTATEEWSYQSGLTISSNLISDVKYLFDDTTYALMGKTESIQFLQTTKNTRERKKCLEIQRFATD